MFIGHFAVGIAAKRAAPRASLGTYLLAAQFLDLLWPLFVLLGIESVRIAPGITVVTPLDFTSYPYSHSLLASGVWAALFGFLHWRVRGNPRESVLLGLVVLSHWVLDFVSHRPDMPLDLSSSTRVGLNLWSSLVLTLVVELGMFTIACVLYLGATKARDRTGNLACWGLIAFLLVVYLAAQFGPPPPSVPAMVWTTQSMWLLVAWGYWVDRHRESEPGLQASSGKPSPGSAPARS
jgi:hypothetical protein